jgi:putative endonuclease
MKKRGGNRRKGDFYEGIAVEYLLKNHFFIIARNYSTRFGEIDIICSKGDHLVFIEVKGRRRDYKDFAYQSITHKKKKRLYHAINEYLYHNPAEVYRFDVIVVTLQKNKLAHVQHYLAVDLF